MTTQLAREMKRLKHGDHACPIYENRGEQMAVALTFIQDGLAAEERCIYVTEDSQLEDVAATFAAAKLDVPSLQKRGALQILPARDVYLRAGKFHPQAMLDFLAQAEKEALAQGFSGLRYLGDMAWALDPKVDGEQLVTYEILLNKFLAKSRSIVLCQYSRPRFDGALIHDLLRAHPVAILGVMVCPNPYYEPPDLLLRQDQTGIAELKRARVDWWIDQLRAARTSENELERLNRLYDALRQINHAIAQSKTREELFPEVCRVAVRVAEFMLAWIGWRHPGSNQIQPVARCGDDGGYLTDTPIYVDERPGELGPASFAFRSGQPYICNDFSSDPATLTLREKAQRAGIQSSAAFPFRLKNEVVGTLAVYADTAGYFQRKEILLLMETARDLSFALDNFAREEERRSAEESVLHLSERLLRAQDEERRRLARELHDTTAQSVAALAINLAQLERAPLDEKQRRLLAASEDIAQQSVQELRTLSYLLHPPVLDQVGLIAGLKDYVEGFQKRSGIQVETYLVGLNEHQLQPGTKLAVFRIVQEALSNIWRHSGSRGASISLSIDSHVRLEVSDHGHGFDISALDRSGGAGVGVAGMRERVRLLGGKLTVDSGPDGTVVRAVLPI